MASTAPGMSAVNPGITPVDPIQEGAPRRGQPDGTVTDSSACLLGGLVNMARGIGTTLGIALMALALRLGLTRAR
jgi:hypothetical protein